MDRTPKTGLTEGAKKIINQNVLSASGAGLIPLPLLDFAAISACKSSEEVGQQIQIEH